MAAQTHTSANDGTTLETVMILTVLAILAVLGFTGVAFAHETADATDKAPLTIVQAD